MFFKKKKEEAEEKKALLYRENVKVGCGPMDKEQVIRSVGQMLVDSGYVDQPYVDAMVEREKTFSTFMGNGLALPHGVEAAKKEVKSSGIAVMTFDKGIDWDGNEVHMDILANIADIMMDEASSEKLISGDADTIYGILTA